MNIKKSIIGSLFSMLLVSEMAAADWGDVYYCQMIQNLGLTLEGETKYYTLDKFQFKLDQTKNAMVFGSTGYYQGIVFDLDKTLAWISQEAWYANGKYSMTYFEEGKFMFTFNNSEGITSVSANYEKF